MTAIEYIWTTQPLVAGVCCYKLLNNQRNPVNVDDIVGFLQSLFVVGDEMPIYLSVYLSVDILLYFLRDVRRTRK